VEGKIGDGGRNRGRSMKTEDVVCSFCGKSIPADRAFHFATRKSCGACEAQYLRELEDAEDEAHQSWMKRPVVGTEENEND
jgi:ribosomal protein S26